MTDPDAVARALARLARGAPRNREDRSNNDPNDCPARVVADAEAAMDELSRAAAFVDAGGEARLRHATQRAQSAGDDALAARGRAVLSALSAFRQAASGGGESSREPPSGRRTTSTPLAQRSSGEGA